MRVADFDYALPADLIAQEPLPERDASRLLLLDRRTGGIAHHQFRELPALLRPDDMLVVNDSRVIPARLRGKKETGGRAEVLLIQPRGDGSWLALTRPGLRPGSRVAVGPADGRRLLVDVEALQDDGLRLVRLSSSGEALEELLEQVGELPTPPYVRRRLAEPGRYQTVYAEQRGSIAAPTAGLHFTPGVLAALDQRGIGVERLTLHVGLGTFLPVRTEEVAAHQMHGDQSFYNTR